MWEIIHSGWYAGALGVLFFVLVFVRLYYLWKKQHRKLRLTMFVFLLVFGLRCSVTFCGSLPAELENGVNLNFIEMIGDSLLHSFQTFSMDESYTDYTLTGKMILTEGGSAALANVYGFIVTLLDIAAPLLGGFLLLELVTGFFPTMMLMIHPFRHKFVFSELNEMSVSLAEDICSGYYKMLVDLKRFEPRPMIIFTDVYTDESSESLTELYDRAKALKAVCIRNDLTSLSFRLSRSVRYLLIDEDSIENINAFSQLMKHIDRWPSANRRCGSFTLRVQMQQKCSIDPAKFAEKAELCIQATDLFGNDTDLLALDGKIVTENDLRGMLTDCRLEDPAAEKPCVVMTFVCGSRPLDRSRPFRLSVGNLAELAENVCFGKEDDISGSRTVSAYCAVIPDEEYCPRTQIYTFVRSDYQALTVNHIYSASGDSSYQCMLKVIRDYKNAAVRLLMDVPLFVPLLYKPEPERKELHVTILGSGTTLFRS